MVKQWGIVNVSNSTVPAVVTMPLTASLALQAFTTDYSLSRSAIIKSGIGKISGSTIDIYFDSTDGDSVRWLGLFKA